MNYYEHHLGDYVRKAGHLSMVEDGAYRRLIDAYYIHEKPLPPDVAKCCKLVRAATKAERDAVASVLEEFFELRDDGYHQNRADEEIERYLLTEPEREAKRENDRERQHRARARRRALFDQLRAYGVVPPFSSPTAFLESELSRVTKGKSSHHVTRDNTATREARDDTATQTPDTRHQSPREEKTKITTRNGSARGSLNGHAPTRAGLVCKGMKSAGVADVNPGHPDLLALIDAGATDAEFVGAAELAVKKRKGFAYAIGALMRQRTEAAQKANGLHRGPLEDAKPWDHDGGTIRKKGIELGLGDWDRDGWEHQQPGAETFQAYHRRVAKAVKQREEHPA